MAFVAAATLGAGLLGAGASIYASNKQSDAAAQAAAIQQQQMAENKKNMAPFISGGQGASNLLQSFYGIGGDPALGKSALDRFYQSPDYQFALKAGGEALDNSAAARGGMINGNQMLAQTQFGQGLATQNLGNYLSRLSGMAGQGIQAAGGIAGPNTSGAYYTGRDIMGGGTAQASGLLGAYNNLKGGFGEMQKLGDASSYGGNVLTSSPSYGGGNVFNSAWGGSRSNPLPGLSADDYG